VGSLVRTAVAGEEFEGRVETFAERSNVLEAPATDPTPFRVLAIGEPAPQFLALSNALARNGAEVVGETEIIKDRRFLRKERIRYESASNKIIVTARQLRVGDAVVSVAMASLEASAADNDRQADEVAGALPPHGQKGDARP